MICSKYQGGLTQFQDYIRRRRNVIRTQGEPYCTADYQSEEKDVV